MQAKAVVVIQVQVQAKVVVLIQVQVQAKVVVTVGPQTRRCTTPQCELICQMAQILFTHTVP